LFDGWEYRQPIWLLFWLYQLGAEQTTQSNGLMLDAFLAQKAKKLEKRVYSIETAEEQCSPLISVNQEQIIFAINYTLSYLEWSEFNHNPRKANGSTTEELIRLYNCGSLKVAQIEGWRLHESGFTLNPELDEQARQVDTQLKHDIIDQRNSRMAMRAHKLMSTHPGQSFLFALGAGKFKNIRR
jgi:uncharacterized protein YbaP (TraB family)